MSGGGVFGKLFKGGGRDWMILVFSLFLAFFMWSIQKLSQNYSAYIKYRINLHCPLEGRVQSAFADNLLVVRGKSSGFYILQRMYEGDDAQVLDIHVEPKQLRKAENSPDMFYMISADIKTKIDESLGGDFQVENLATDTLYFNFPGQSYKKVPVIARNSFRYKAQYMPFTHVVLKPDSLLIYGRSSLLEKIDSVFTERIRGEELDEPVSGIIPVATIKGIRFSVKDVYYSQDIGRYVENTANIKVGLINFPAGKNVVIIPQEVRIKYRSLFNETTVRNSDFFVAVDYNHIEDNGNIVKPVLLRSPRNIYSVNIEPHFVECIVN